MEIQPLPSQPPVQRTDGNALALRLNQRVRAEVLQVLGEQVLLDVNGTQITARVVGADVAELLNQGAQAQFVIAGLQQDVITLKLLKGEQGAEQAPSTALLINNLLKGLGLQSDAMNTEIARALLSQQLELSPKLFAEMRDLLAQMPAWTERDAAFAAALKAAGLPLTLETLALAKYDVSQLGQLLAELKINLGSVANSANQAQQSAALARLALSSLAQLSIDWGQPPGELAGRLQSFLSQLGRSVENLLVDTALRELPDNLLLSLQRLSQALIGKGEANVGRQLKEFTGGLRAIQLSNATGTSGVDTSQWLSFSLPLTDGAQSNKTHMAQLRIAYDQDVSEQAINPQQTRMLLQVDLEGDEYLQVDFSIVGKQMGGEVRASSDTLVGFAQNEFASLEAGLSGLGYTLNTPRYAVKPANDGSPVVMDTTMPFDRIKDRMA
ncbi:MAG: hypothetical protein DWQ07_05210 [Chloroflexi bacterium]|nr:MAG: hypothetical protein DWQ07_05210 [Chloroflexota bacterium]MBL1194832.1 hypothetical protein [Chloroflexota bacterium]NOH12123.1 hypothetical protein [Chloroflexota bacterium]